jgi:ABC-2 type transport system ATP-binding protein
LADAALQIEGLTKDYAVGFWRRRQVHALDALDLEVPRGEVFGFLGRNGAGKTTTLKLLMQLIFPTAGRARILGAAPGSVEVRRRIGYLPENPAFYDYLTPEELLNHFAELFGYSGGERTRRVAALLDRAGLGPERRSQIRRLSKGEVQRFGIAQALVNDPEVVFLDEPMSGLDPLGRRDVRELIRDLGSQGRTVFFSSHILADAEAVCSRIGLLEKGRLLAVGPLRDLAQLEERGWELVVEELAPAALERARGVASRVTAVGGTRYAFELTAGARPEPLIADLIASGASLVSVNPIRQTLEDFFVERVAAAGGAPPRTH